jgi:hypothetical protein
MCLPNMALFLRVVSLMVDASLESKKAADILFLQDAVQNLHKCGAIHSKTVFVDEKFGGRTLWHGEVEVFELVGHGRAANCFAWVHEDDFRGTRPIILLDRWPINSPQMAVKTAIALDISHGFKNHLRS